MTRPKVSIIMPLQWHRDMAPIAIRAWTAGQSVSRDGVAELIVTAGPRTTNAEMDVLEAALLPDDRLIRSEHAHDMGQVEVGARAASGEWLLFTESHCVPFDDTLAITLRVIEEHPDWAGFSGGSVGLAGNRLARMEARFYANDIRDTLERNTWRKVLDQCFAIRREAYFHAGGFRSKYGHFAEHLLAAELHRLGYVIGHDPRLRIQHKYSGSVSEIETFTRDFCAGEIAFQQERAQHACADYFPTVAEMDRIHEFDRVHSRRMLTFCCRTRVSAALALKWAANFVLKARGELGRTQLRITAMVALVRLGQFILPYELQSRMFRNLMVEVIHHERLLRSCQLVTGPAPTEVPVILGGHATEVWHGRRFRWLEPVGMLLCHVGPGRYRLTLELLPLLADWEAERVRFFVNGRPVSADRDAARHQWLLEFESSGQCPVEIGVTAPRRRARGDRRRLALPIASVHCAPLPA
jgi:hypothetical protein